MWFFKSTFFTQSKLKFNKGNTMKNTKATQAKTLQVKKPAISLEVCSLAKSKRSETETKQMKKVVIKRGRRGTMWFIDDAKEGLPMGKIKISIYKAAKVITCNGQPSEPQMNHLRNMGVEDKLVIDTKRQNPEESEKAAEKKESNLEDLEAVSKSH